MFDVFCIVCRAMQRVVWSVVHGYLQECIGCVYLCAVCSVLVCMCGLVMWVFYAYMYDLHVACGACFEFVVDCVWTGHGLHVTVCMYAVCVLCGMCCECVCAVQHVL